MFGKPILEQVTEHSETKTLTAEQQFSFDLDASKVIREARLACDFTGTGTHNDDTMLHSLELMVGGVPFLSLSKDVNGYHTASKMLRILNILQERNPELHADTYVMKSRPFIHSPGVDAKIKAKVSPEATIGGDSFAASANLELVTKEAEVGAPGSVPAFNVRLIERDKTEFTSVSGWKEIPLPVGEEYDEEGLYILIQDGSGPADEIFTELQVVAGESTIVYKSREIFLQQKMAREAHADPATAPLKGIYHVPLPGLDARNLKKLRLRLLVPSTTTFSVTTITATRSYNYARQDVLGA